MAWNAAAAALRSRLSSSLACMPGCIWAQQLHIVASQQVGALWPPCCQPACADYAAQQTLAAGRNRAAGLISGSGPVRPARQAATNACDGRTAVWSACNQCGHSSSMPALCGFRVEYGDDAALEHAPSPSRLTGTQQSTPMPWLLIQELYRAHTPNVSAKAQSNPIVPEAVGDAVVRLQSRHAVADPRLGLACVLAPWVACRHAVAAARYRSAPGTSLAARSSAACKAAAWPAPTGPWAPVAGAWRTLSEEAGLAWQQADTMMWLPRVVCPARYNSQAASCLGSGWSHAATLPGVSLAPSQMT